MMKADSASHGGVFVSKGRFEKMIIAVTYDSDGSVFQHFGHSEAFKVYRCEDGKVVSSEIVSSDGQGHGALAGLLSGHSVDALICGGIGMGAKMALEGYGIRLYAGVTGSADEAVAGLLAGTLAYSEDANCSHHAEGHECHHGSGGHECGHGHDAGHECHCHHD